MIRKLLGSFFAITALLAMQATAQTVDELIKKSVDARGGIQKLKAIKSIRMTGKITPQGLEIPIVLQAKRPSFVRMEITFQGKSQIQAYDGETGWKVDPFQGSSEPEKVAGDDLKDLQEQSDLDGAMIDYKEKGHSVELIGKEDVEGTPAYKLKLTLKTGDVRYIYLDADNYLELKVTSKRKTPGGEVEVDQYPGNYKPVNGIVFPYSIETKLKGQTINTIIIEKIELDVPIDASLFKMPAKPQDKPKTDEKPKDKPPSKVQAATRKTD
jgi:outer membrane lipoprotein-sorting protein